MAWMNGVKVLGVLALLLGVHPVLAFAVVGFGAAAYAPAKYGLITEMVPPEQLVAANGWVEVSVVCAALLGTVLGGVLVSPWLLGCAAGRWLPAPGCEALRCVDASALSALAARAAGGLRAGRRCSTSACPTAARATRAAASTRWRCCATSGAPTGRCGATATAACRWP